MSVPIKIERYSHGCRITGFDVDSRRLTLNFLETLSLKEPQRVERKMVMLLKKRYYGMTKNQREVFIHRNSLKPYLTYMKEMGHPESKINIVDIPVPTPTTVEYYVDPKFKPRDYQIPIVDELSDNVYSRRLDLQTGFGKTFCTLKAVSLMNIRGMAMLPPKYFGIWIKALNETYGDSIKYRQVSGSGELKQIIIDALEGNLTEEFILMSAVTYRNYIEAYEEFADNLSDQGYMVAPPRFHEALGIGVQINDEFQEDPGLFFRIDVFSNIRKMIYLSATPYTGNQYVTRMIDVMTPPETRCTIPEWERYIDTVSLLYSDPTVQPKDYLTPFKNTYNHARYETQLRKSKRRLEQYLMYVRRAVEGLYVKDRLPGQKALVLCATVEFIYLVTKFLKKEFPELEINYHVSGCPYERILTNDITVSTIKSSGTGVDIPNLREIIRLHATGSEKDNVQIMGRGRKLKDFPDVTPRMSYFTCHNIPQHLRYQNDVMNYFKSKARYQRIARL